MKLDKPWLVPPAALSLLVVLINACSNPTTPPAPHASSYLISGALTYTGSLGTVSSSHTLAAALSANANLGSVSSYQQNTSNGASYTLGAPGAGTYYLFAFLRVASPACDPSLVTTFPLPHQGDPYFLYDGSACSPGVPITLSTAGTLSISVTFGDTCRFNGVSGSVNYTGSNAVNTSHGIVMALYADSSYVTLDPPAREYVQCNNTSFSLGTPNGSPEYLQAFVDVAGTGMPVTGDPYIKYGAVTLSPTLAVAVSFGDTNKF